MARDLIDRRRRTQVVIAVLAVGIVMSVLVAVGLVHMGPLHPWL